MNKIVFIILELVLSIIIASVVVFEDLYNKDKIQEKFLLLIFTIIIDAIFVSTILLSDKMLF